MNEQNFLNDLFEQINQWLISARLGQTVEYDVNEVIDDYFLQSEIRRCFQTIWTTIKTVDEQKTLLVEHIDKDTYDQRLKENPKTTEEFAAFIQSINGFTRLIRYISEQYRKPIVGMLTRRHTFPGIPTKEETVAKPIESIDDDETLGNSREMFISCSEMLGESFLPRNYRH